MAAETRIAVGLDREGWYEQAAAALAAAPRDGFTWETVRLEGHDWAKRIAPFDVVIWNPGYMGPVSSQYFKEKVVFLENVLKKRVVPNLATVWHFESKVAQAYLFAELAVPHPRTVVSFDCDDALEQAASLDLPLVAKLPWGAKSEGVRLVRTRQGVQRYIEQRFSQQMWDREKERHPSSLATFMSCLPKHWFADKVVQVLARGERTGCVLLQEFVPNNRSDLRINVFGRRAVGYWRDNREGDFRASGAGLRDYDRPIPEEPVKLCLDLSRRIGADCMAYDILFREGEPLVAEMSYGSIPETVHAAKGHWIEGDGVLRWVEGHTWPQELLVTSLLEELGASHVDEYAQAAARDAMGEDDR